MARLDYRSGEGEIADRIRERRGGHLTPLDQTLLHSPPIADGWNSLLGAIRTRASLPAGIRELAILRVAALNGADYEWNAHEPIARDAGLTRTDALRVEAPADAAASLTAPQRAALAYTDAMTRSVAVPDEIFDALREHFSDQHVVELTATIGAYNMVSRFLIALHVGEPNDRNTSGGMSSPVSTPVPVTRTSGDRDANQPPETTKRETRLDATTTANRGEAGLS
ncbi:carboxymuconolactone decarboxylase family protein [Saccharopolyspora sp. K220]|uniref:carboxymuconolactone decarboxylase family protein n=1 Tax=Saccharopolyspora soli TaxID=2926618 RepID=UPI001F57FBC7|nr:carboxymuconolactone decarboxylase family protein [Saccharopolyspora soli]MCI2422270.1 carboxymuconolactone decarboxylase family protein [Saccharopolyspora soli]